MEYSPIRKDSPHDPMLQGLYICAVPERQFFSKLANEWLKYVTKSGRCPPL